MEGDNNLVYGACNRNYAAQIGMYVLDGCGEFALDSAGSRYCEACGCDKNFHLVIAPNRTTTTSNLGAKPNTNMSTRINGGRIRLSINENSVLTLVRDEDDDDDDQVEVNGPEIVDERSTATSGTKSKKNKKKNKK